MAKKLLFLLITALLIGGGNVLPCFAEIPFIAGARALGMGGAFSALADDGSSLYWNPAGLGDVQKRELSGMYSKDAFGTGYAFASYAQPVDGFGGCAGGWARTASDFEKTDVQGNVTGNGTVSSDTVFLGASYYQALPVSFGLTVRGMREAVDSFSLSGAAADLGLLYVREPFRAALVWQNAWASGLSGNSVTGSGTITEQAAAVVRGGVAVSLKTGIDLAGEEKASRLPVTVTAACDYVQKYGSFRETEINPGVELWLGRGFAVRSGMADLRDYSAGVSLQLGIVRVDYAFINSQTLENQHIISTAFYF